MKNRLAYLTPFLAISLLFTQIVKASTGSGIQNAPLQATGRTILASEPGANSVALPKQILHTGVNIFSNDVSLNSRQLADNMGLTAIFEQMRLLQIHVSAGAKRPNLEYLAARQDLSEMINRIDQMIIEAELEIDFVLAQISAEQNIYTDVLAAYQADRDKVVARANASSYYANGALWAVGEGFDVPTYRVPKYSIPSGTVSILAGVMPSVLSLYAMKKFNGKKANSEVAPNMLAKIFDYPTSPEIEYPKLVWDYLNSPPADEPGSKSRKEQLIDRWVADSNIPSFTDRSSRKILDVVTASVSHNGALTIDSLNLRQVMLAQLGAEIMKMKRLLLELIMVARNEKQF
jgi:hypothetical protein